MPATDNPSTQRKFKLTCRANFWTDTSASAAVTTTLTSWRCYGSQCPGCSGLSNGLNLLVLADPLKHKETHILVPYLLRLCAVSMPFFCVISAMPTYGQLPMLAAAHYYHQLLLTCCCCCCSYKVTGTRISCKLRTSY